MLRHRHHERYGWVPGVFMSVFSTEMLRAIPSIVQLCPTRWGYVRYHAKRNRGLRLLRCGWKHHISKHRTRAKIVDRFNGVHDDHLCTSSARIFIPFASQVPRFSVTCDACSTAGRARSRQRQQPQQQQQQQQPKPYHGICL